MSGTAYLKRSREQLVTDQVLKNMESLVSYMHRTNPLPLGEEAIDRRTAAKRLAQVPEDQLHDYLGRLG